MTYKCENTNFITIFYGKESDYINGFKNEYRKDEDIDFIIGSNHNKKYSASDKLSLLDGGNIQIYFKQPLESIEQYFSVVYDLNMDNIISVDFSNFDSSLLTDMKSLFLGCNSLQTVDFTKFNTSLVTNMALMFFGCSSLKSIDLSYFDTTSVLYMNHMFSGCSSLESLDLSNFYTPSVVNLDEMFYECISLKYLDLSKLTTSLVTNMNYMFSGCTSLQYLDISHFITNQVSKSVSIFKNVTNLKYINLYRVEDINGLISESELNNLDNLKVCQTNNILKNQNIFNICCAYNIETDKCEYTNYIIVYYGKDVEYNEGFKNDYRNSIDYIINGKLNSKISDSEPLKIEKNIKIEIHFKTPLQSLESFFDVEKDNNCKDIILIDLSYLDSSKITNLNSAFYGCNSLKYIYFSYFNTSLVTDMEYMFGDCSSIKFLDLSQFDTSLVTNMKNMFIGCTSLESLDLSSFNTSLITSFYYMLTNCSSLVSLNLSNFKTPALKNVQYMFSGCTSLKVLDISSFNLNSVKSGEIEAFFKDVLNLKYINIYNVEDKYNRIVSTELNTMKNLTVCQSAKILANEDVSNKCCSYDIKTNKCKNDNYIIVYFNAEEETEYINGFGYESYGDKIDIRINNIDYIIKEGGSSPILINESFSIKPNSKIEIYLKPNVTSLKKFFDFNYDYNSENIISIDFSNLDTSLVTNFDSIFSGCDSLKSINLTDINTTLVTNMDSMFYGCSSLESVDLTYFNTSSLTNMDSMFSLCNSLKTIYLSNFNTSLVTNMNSIFYGCSSLESIDLSYFNTSSVIEMNNMFDGCQSLVYLDILNFNLINVKSYKDMFSGVSKLKYINLYNVQDTDNILSKFEIKDIGDLTVCQKENILSDKKQKCCYFDIASSKCKSDNYITVYYGESAEYPNGFENAFRKGMSFIVNEDYESPLKGSDEFKIKSGCKIKIYFDFPITDLESFFDINYDKNVENIVSIDLSHFKSEKINKINKMFLGCNSLKSIDLSQISISSINNMNFMFFNCKELVSVDLSVFDTSLVTDMSYMFAGCTSLKSINFSYLNTSLVKNGNYMFYRCNSFESIDLSEYKTSFLENMDKMFYECNNLTSLNLSKFETQAVINMNKMFYGCDLLNYIDLSNFNMANCNIYSNMFSEINNIKFINLHNVKNDKYISNAFNKAKALFVCQSKKIIKNPKAYNCCDYNFETEECDFIPIIGSTISSTLLETSEFMTEYNSFSQLISQDISTSNIEFKEAKSSFIEETIESSINSIDNSEKEILLTSYIDERIENINSTDILSDRSEQINSYVNSINISNDEYHTEEVSSSPFVDNPKFTTSNLLASNSQDIEEPTTTKNNQGELTGSSILAQETNYKSTLEEKDSTSLPSSLIGIQDSNTNSQIITDIPKVQSEQISTLVDYMTSKISMELTVFTTKNEYTSTTSMISKPTNLPTEKENTPTNSFISKSTNIPTTKENISTTSMISKSTNLPTEKENIPTTSMISKPTNIPTTKENIPTSSMVSKPTNTKDNVPTTILSTTKENVPTTSMYSKSTNIPTETENIPTTSMYSKSTNIPTTKENISTTSMYSKLTNIPTEKENILTTSLISKTTNIPTTKENIPTTSSISQSQLKTDAIKQTNIPTIPKIINSTVIEVYHSTIIENKESEITKTETISKFEKAHAIVLGFSEFKQQSLTISFKIHFVSINGFVLSPVLIFYVDIISNRILRILENHEAICLRNDNNVDDDIKEAIYSCTVQSRISNIKQIKIIPDYNFTSQDVEIVGISPIAQAFLDDLQNVGEGKSNFTKTSIYILEHSKVNKSDDLFFNITGIINGTQPNFSSLDFVLKINTEVDNNTQEVDSNCKIIDIIDNNYTLNCEGEKNVKYNLQAAVSMIENDILVINFDDDADCQIILDSSSSNYGKFYYKKEGGISTGVIVIIILFSILLLASLIILVIYIIKRNRRNKLNNTNNLDSVIQQIKKN